MTRTDSDNQGGEERARPVSGDGAARSPKGAPVSVTLSQPSLGVPMRIAVFGLGYVGTVTAAGLASRGHDVCGVDVDEIKVGLIRQGRSPVVEPGLDDLVASGVAAGRLSATTRPADALAGADVSLLCVGT